MEKVLQSKLEGKNIWKGASWSYLDALHFQNELVSSYDTTPTFIASVHEPVFSVGKSMRIEQSSINNIPIVPVERGGKAMFHGPGQLTVYPVIRLVDYFKGPKEYVCFLFCTLKDYFKEKYNIELLSHDNGLWTISEASKPLKKVGFIGLRIKKGIAYHGFSLNYHCELENFKILSPCNINGDRVGNLFSKEIALENEAVNLIRFISNRLVKK